MLNGSVPGEAGKLSSQGRVLHSRYNPVAEAERYVNSLSLRQETQFFILIEPGLGYIIPLLQKQCPQARIIALHVQGSLAAPQPAVCTWCPETGIPLPHFLEQTIPDTEADALQIIEWRPALAVYGAEYLRLLTETVEFIKRIDANKRTIRTFGRRWFRNFFKNIGILHRIYTAPAGCLGSLPLIVTGAGPSLEETLPLMREVRNHSSLLILAAASSVPALLTGGIVPDFVITTDGGGWARLHLYDCLRSKPPFGLAASLIAALPSQCAEVPILVISDGSCWQNLVLQGLAIPGINLLQRGTVTAQALDLAFVLTSGPIYITGMDLANQDIRTHARPYSFERLLEEKATRFNPVYSQSFVRSRAIEAGGSHRIYASWFKERLGAYPRPIVSLGANNPVFKDLARPPESLGLAVSGTPDALSPELGKPLTFQAPDNPIKIGMNLLIAALSMPHTAARVQAELFPLLCADPAAHQKEGPGTTKLEDIIHTLIEPEYQHQEQRCG
ncbi:MAG: DUF115 domain-containing protein [Treponema sp.]|jgi:hypothetical protein|nr:DUF115 domain-containing protein [Treponema sp.]